MAGVSRGPVGGGVGAVANVSGVFSYLFTAIPVTATFYDRSSWDQGYFVAMVIQHPAFVSYRQKDDGPNPASGRVDKFTEIFHTHIRGVCSDHAVPAPFIDRYQVQAGDGLSEKIRDGMISSCFYFCIISPRYFLSELRWPIRELVFARKIIDRRRELGDNKSKIIYIISLNPAQSSFEFLDNDVLRVDCSGIINETKSVIEDRIAGFTVSIIEEAVAAFNCRDVLTFQPDQFSSLSFPKVDSPEVEVLVRKFQEAIRKPQSTLRGGNQ